MTEASELQHNITVATTTARDISVTRLTENLISTIVLNAFILIFRQPFNILCEL